MAQRGRPKMGGLSYHIKQILGVAILASREYRRNLESLASGLLWAFALTVMLYFLLKSEEAFLFVATGYIVAGSFNAGGTVVQRIITTWRLIKSLDIVMVSPLRPYNFVLGAALAASTYGFASDFIYISVLSVIVGKPEIILLAVTVAPLMALIGVLIGLNITLRVKSTVKAVSIHNTVFQILFFIPPVFYPLSNVPEALRPLVFVAPTGLGAELVRMLAGVGEPVYPLEIIASALLLWLISLTLFLMSVMKWSLD